MRFLLQATVPTEVGNAKVKDGTVSDTLQALLGVAKPEAVFFADGIRRTYMIVNVKDAAELSLILEAWHLGFSADVEVNIACTPEDADMASARIPEIVAKFA